MLVSNKLIEFEGRGIEREIIYWGVKSHAEESFLQQKGIISLPFGLYVIKNWESGFRTALLVGGKRERRYTSFFVSLFLG